MLRKQPSFSSQCIFPSCSVFCKNSLLKICNGSFISIESPSHSHVIARSTEVDGICARSAVNTSEVKRLQCFQRGHATAHILWNVNNQSMIFETLLDSVSCLCCCGVCCIRHTRFYVSVSVCMSLCDLTFLIFI